MSEEDSGLNVLLFYFICCLKTRVKIQKCQIWFSKLTTHVTKIKGDYK
jgi:hypothetical protein